ncbi:glycosyltransferase family 4 protein [Allorhizocola rhizosphaerae]|uniref:glycosyltransferase family 4 protein n=1 Tax=Allorhizocola rhizosphaerae TaxID=1872709 RepID=UPI000E3E224A|nr:glycosyltransferase family 4 protein [Allorhizocola rhizosphaerae]
MVVPPYFDLPPRAYGGVEAVVADLADALVEAGHRVTLIGAGRHGTKARFLPVWEAAIPERLGEAFPEIAHASLARNAVERLLHREGLDVVHDHTGAGPLNAPFYTSIGLPTVVTAHGPVTGDLGKLYRTLSDHIQLVAISHRQRRLAPDLPWVSTVHNALRIQDWPFAAQKDDYALFLGRFHPDKGAHLALDAAHAAGLRLVLAGKCAEPVEKAYFEAEIRPRLTESDHFFGMADAGQKRALLAKARCLLLPIQWEEPFGMVMIEALACGTPVVALNRGAVPEIVTDGETGIICTEPDELPQALKDVTLLSPAACRRRVTLHFNTDRLARGYEHAYRTALTVSGLQAVRPAPVDHKRNDSAPDVRCSL